MKVIPSLNKIVTFCAKLVMPRQVANFVDLYRKPGAERAILHFIKTCHHSADIAWKAGSHRAVFLGNKVRQVLVSAAHPLIFFNLWELISLFY